MTTEIAARGHSGATQREPFLDGPNIGLFPQLIDVIRALTDGQELLSKKLRDVRDAYADPPVVLDEFRYQCGSDIAGPLTSAGQESTPPAAGPRHAKSRSSFESGAIHALFTEPLPASADETTQLVSPVAPFDESAADELDLNDIREASAGGS